MLATKLTQQQLDTLTRLREPGFAPVLEVLRELEKQASAALAKADEPKAMYRLQGRIAFIEALLQAINQQRNR